MLFHAHGESSLLFGSHHQSSIADIAGISAHQTSENKRQAVEILAAVFGGGSGKIADGQMEERTSLVTPMSEN